TELVQQGAAREAVVDDTRITTEHVHREAHGPTRYFYDEYMTDAHGLVRDGLGISYGTDVVDDLELRVCGDVRNKRALELGIHGATPNGIILARKGARVVTVDPRRDAIQRARHAAAEHEVSVEFHESDPADLGSLMSASVDLAVSVHQITHDTDIARLFRQVHRVLRPEAGFVFAIVHPAAAIFDRNDPTARRRYGDSSPTIGELAMALQRTNFAVDVMHELMPTNRPDAVVPSTLVVRARKLGS
ncbi:MAG: class I SAM-dependent methyltransferase, partial [Actinomycetota bacterium]